MEILRVNFDAAQFSATDAGFKEWPCYSPGQARHRLAPAEIGLICIQNRGKKAANFSVFFLRGIRMQSGLKFSDKSGVV